MYFTYFFVTDFVKMKAATTLFSLTAPRREREEILEDFNRTLRRHELIINKLSVERRGLIDYMQDGRALTQRRYDSSNLIPQNRMCIRNLTVGKCYPGKFILCRIIAGSYQMTSVMTVVEDPLGTVERLCLFNWCDQELAASTTFASRSFIPIGTIVAIQNPAYVLASDGHPVIRLDKPSDLVLLDHHHPIFYGLSWMGQKTKTLPGYEPPSSPKLNRYALTSQQTSPTFGRNMIVTSGPSTPKSRRHTIGSPETARNSGMNLLLTPPSSGSTSKSHRRQEKKKAKRPKQKRQSLFVMINQAGKSMSDRESAMLLALCLLVFLWYLFLA